MSFAENLANVVNRYDEISSLLSSPDVTPENLVKMNKELAELGPVVEAVNHYRKAEKDLNDAKAMMEDPGMDREMREMAEAEYYELKEKLTHSNVDCVANKVCVKALKKSFAGENFRRHSSRMCHTRATDCLNECFYNNAVLYIKAELARTLLRSTPADAV